MRYVVIGAGGVGTLIAVLLARGGSEVVLYARPAAAAAIRARGGGRIDGPLGCDGELVPLTATADPHALDADVAIVCVKAHQLESAIDACAPALARARTVAVMQNGIPWWYFAGVAGANAGRRIAAVDPNGRIERALPAAKVVGGVVEAAGLILEPGVVRTGANARFTLGAVTGAANPDVGALAEAVRAGGAEGIVSDDIRLAVWRKLLGNLPQLPMAALTRASPREMCEHPVVMEAMIEVAEETLALARAYGYELGITGAERMEQSRRVGAHLSSMLQDVLAARKLELGTLCFAPLELAELAGVPMPATRRITGMTQLLEQSLERRGVGGG